MWENQTDAEAVGILSPPRRGAQTILVLGASDTGKTTFAIELAMRLTQSAPVAFVDADIGQSRIGPPATVGWALLDDPQKDFSQFDTRGIFFVGAVSPVGHLLQFTAALVKCVRQAAAAAEIVIIDTPGFVGEPAATSLWWAVQDILQPTKILLLQRKDEMQSFVEGVKGFDSQLEFIKTSLQVPLKSMPQRQAHRQQKFEEYFRNTSVCQISLNNVAVQARENVASNMFTNRIIALRDSAGMDLAIGVVISLDEQQNVAYVKAPAIDIGKVAAMIIGDVSYEGHDT